MKSLNKDRLELKLKAVKRGNTRKPILIEGDYDEPCDRWHIKIGVKDEVYYYTTIKGLTRFQAYYATYEHICKENGWEI